MIQSKWESIAVEFDKSVWGRRDELYKFIRQVYADADADHKSFQVYRYTESSKWHISFRFEGLKNKEALLVRISDAGYTISNIFPYEENEHWLRASTFASRWVLTDLALFAPDWTSPDKEFLFYLVHSIFNNLFLDYQEESELFTRLQKWATKRVEAGK